MVLPDSHRVSRALWYSGYLQSQLRFRLRAYHPVSGSFPESSAILIGPIMEVLQPQRDESRWFGLIRLRSPLLAESRLISFPLGTEMFHFPRLASTCLCVRHAMNGRAVQVSPFGHLRVKGCLAPHRSFSQLATSFIASAHQGIHRSLLVA